MFELLSEKLAKVFKGLSGKGRVTEKDVDQAMREVRVALLEADVNFRVVKDFVARVRERAVGSQVLESLTPAQQIIKIVNEELVATLGKERVALTAAPHPPTVILMVGLQGGGKTTTAAKLALQLKKSGQKPLLVAADNRRPAAIDQLVILGKQLDVPVFSESPDTPSKDISAHGLARARELGAGWVIVDTAGRLHIDDEMMGELTRIKALLQPAEVLLVVDAMTGQDAVRVAEEFNSKVGVTGLVLTKMDGDARGGAALSIRWVAGVPIKYIGIGEKADALEPFYPDRLASRILGMGDMLTFIEKAEKTFDEKQARELEKKVKSATFDFEDFLSQLGAIQKMGSIGQLAEMIPGLSKVSGKIPQEVQEKQLRKVEAIIRSMTPEERRSPAIIGGSRRRRIARGSGVQPQDVNQVLNQFRMMQKFMKMSAAGKMPKNIFKLLR